LARVSPRAAEEIAIESTTAAPARISRRSLGSQIADQLRQEILLGRIPPGTSVSQERLCELYGTSRMPVRDALVALTNEGLVVSTPGGHSVVAQMTRADVEDAFDIGAVVHGRAARRATERAGDEELARLRGLCDEMAAAEAADDVDLLGELNWRFHKEINRLAGSAKLLAMVRSVSMDIPRSYLSELPGWATHVKDEHEAIVEALIARNGDDAERLMQHHLRQAGNHLADYLERRGRFGDSADPHGAELLPARGTRDG